MAATTESDKGNEEFHDIMRENFMDLDLNVDETEEWGPDYPEESVTEKKPGRRTYKEELDLEPWDD